ncbi:hypothetical protein LEP1GSC162_2287 [Leptospira santarosai str. CBC1531]|nr:hypothetical protein LEP1GSC162_2287 [Leptospira santarosai str. CBC1531]
MSSASLNFSLNNRIVFASRNTDLSFSILKNLMKNNPSFSRNSIRSFEKIRIKKYSFKNRRQTPETTFEFFFSHKRKEGSYSNSDSINIEVSLFLWEVL